MKKLFYLIFSAVICATSIMGGAYANPPEFGTTEELGIVDSRIRGFVEECVLNNESKFVYDGARGHALADEFDSSRGIYMWTFPDAKAAHDEEINRCLSNNEEVMYNGRFLSDWAFCELRTRGVECEEITVACCEGPSLHSAVLIPQETDGFKHWYVCDLASMSKFKTNGNRYYRKFLFCPLKEYLDLYGDSFQGAIVNDREYAGYIDGKSVVGGHDIFCWLSQEGHSASVATDIFANQRTDGLRFMASSDYYDSDLQLITFFRALMHMEGFPLQGVLLC